jgi:hypothetical protein
MNIPPPQPSLAPQLTTPAAAAGDSGGSGVPADWAAAWEASHEYSWAKLLFDESGEKLSQDAKKAVEDALGKALDLPLNALDPEYDRFSRAVVLSAVQTLFDVGFGMFVLPVLDPSSVVRGLERTGVASAEGIEDINQGRTFEGSLKIIGEVSSVFLVVAAPITAAIAKGPPPAPGEPSITITLTKGDTLGPGHVKARVVVPAEKDVAPARDMLTDVAFDEVSVKGDVIAVARVKPVNPDLKLGGASFTRRVSPELARHAAAFSDAAVDMSFKGVQSGVSDFAAATPSAMVRRAFDTGHGRTGPFPSTLGEHCATYAAAVAGAGGIPAIGRFGPYFMYLTFKYGGAPGAGLAATGVFAGMMGNTGTLPAPGPTAPPPN